ncbi:MAG TPA: ribosome maturation factor RimP [Bacillota bacterium]|nr:ribosome maturation factor RimP [Compostibacillus humi]HLT55315.1 ribosome maturation factor RimP [Bacillota bacterium]
MLGSKIVKTVEELVRPILDEKGLELVDIEYVKEGKHFFLRVFIDKPDTGVDISECEAVSEALSEKLDEKDPIQDPYFLEVSSPGAERPLKTRKDFENHIGKNVYIKLYEPINEQKEYEGILKDFQNDVITIEYKIKTRTKEAEIPFDKVAKARLAVVF